MMEANPYLIFNGNCAAAFTLYAEVFGGKINDMMRYSETPAKDTTPPDQQNYVIHAKMTAGDLVLMGSDAPPQHFQKMQGMSVCINYDNTADVERAYKALVEGAEQITMPLQQTFWSKSFAMLTDKFGTPWMLGTTERP